jgi:REP element-mobilizing transposase RayT
MPWKIMSTSRSRSRQRAVSFVVGQMKGASAHAINELHPASIDWQDGYGGVTFRRSELETVKHYVATQEARHRLGGLSPLMETCEGSPSDAEDN